MRCLPAHSVRVFFSSIGVPLVKCNRGAPFLCLEDRIDLEDELIVTEKQEFKNPYKGKKKGTEIVYI